ncbi:MAG TPA: Fic family protein [Acholeplasma sp.]|nr:Fic family protein [Acholeplasma sp.]
MERGLLETEQKHLLNIIKDVKEEAKAAVDKEFSILYAHDAVSIEGKNSITLDEAYTLNLAKSLVNRSECEQKEFLNHLKAFDMVINAVTKEKPMTEEMLKDLHQILLDGIMAGGLYRQVNVGLIGKTHQPPDYVKVYDRMKKYMVKLNDFDGDAIELACYAHLGISKIHPFIDGNGRLARLVMNYYLMKAGYLPVSISTEHRQAYFSALDLFKETKDMTPMVGFITSLLIKRYNDYIQALEK